MLQGSSGSHILRVRDSIPILNPFCEYVIVSLITTKDNASFSLNTFRLMVRAYKHLTIGDCGIDLGNVGVRPKHRNAFER